MQKNKIINKKTIIITTIILYILVILTFELLYCNAESINNLVQRENINYNFSLCRIIIYIVFFILYAILKDRFIEETIKVSENKYKRIFIYLSIIASILSIIGTFIIIIKIPLFTRVMSVGLITAFMGTIFIIYISNNYINNIIVTLSTIGIVFSISIPFNHAFDEKKHFMSALNIAFLNFNYLEKPITDKQIEELPHLSKFTTVDNFFKEKYKEQITSEVNMEDVTSTPATYSKITYIVPAIGIWFAKTLGGSIIDIYIMGRLFNLILYGVLICIAIKLMPFKKNIFIIVFLMPLSILLAASYSIDGICIGLVSIFIAYCLKIRKEKEIISFKDIFILIGLFAALLLAKSMAYIMVGTIIFILPIIPTLKENKKYIPIILIIFLILSIILIFSAIQTKNTKITSDTRANGNVDVETQLDYILNNPIDDIKIFLNHIKNTLLNFNWINELNSPTFFTDVARNISIPLILYILYVALTEDDYNMKMKEKIIMLGSFLLTFLMTSIVLYLSFTEVGSLNIKGYQARYILPILSLPLFCISNNKVKTKDNQNRIMNINIASGVFIVIGILQTIIL